MSIEVKIHGMNEVQNILRAAGRRAKNLSRPLTKIGAKMITSIRQNFVVGGRPRRWTPSKRRFDPNHKKQGRPTLRVSSRLMNSTNFTSSANTLTLRNNTRYARIQQFGGKVSIPPKTIKPRRGKFLSWVESGVRRFAKVVRIPGHTVEIPARPFIVFQTDDRTFSMRTLRDHILGESALAADSAKLRGTA